MTPEEEAKQRELAALTKQLMELYQNQQRNYVELLSWCLKYLRPCPMWTTHTQRVAHEQGKRRCIAALEELLPKLEGTLK